MTDPRPVLKEIRSKEGPFQRRGVWYYVLALECGHTKRVGLREDPVIIKLAWCWECGEEGEP